MGNGNPYGRGWVEALLALPERPDPWTPGTHSIWTDTRLEMLAAHLDAASDAASRRPETVEASVRWLRGLIPDGARILDLGCGPGLYTQRLARSGHDVTGVDLSRRSLEHARSEAEREELRITYLEADYTGVALRGTFDLILLVYFDLGVLDPLHLERLLERVRGWLAEDGRFVFDVLTPASLPDDEDESWAVEPAGFWAPRPHLRLERTQLHEPGNLLLDETVVVTEDGPPRVYRVWERRYAPEDIEVLLRSAGFTVEGMVADLTGRAFVPDGEAVGVIARRAG
jgi:SAM-dependent methyltransferase